MKKFLIVAFALLTWCIMPLSAQNDNKKDKSFGEKVSEKVDKVKTDMVSAGNKLGDAIGFEDRVVMDDDYVRVGTKKYMPIYDVNVYHGSEGSAFRLECRTLFARRYPSAAIMSVVIPQTEWVTTEVKTNKQVTGYLQTLYCYVLARQGYDTYINARFTYQRYRDITNGQYEPLSQKWPLLERIDELTRKQYGKVLSK